MVSDKGNHPINRKRLKELLEQLKVLTSGALVRWDIIAGIIEILIGKLMDGMEYNKTYIRPWELNKYEIKPGSALSTIRILVNLRVLAPLDKKVEPPEVNFSAEGLQKLKKDIEAWDEIFKLTKGYLLERPALQVLRERLNVLNGLIKRTKESQSQS